MTQLNFEVGKYYKTRNGHKARIYSTDSTANRCIHGAVLYPDGDWRSHAWHANGQWFPVFEDQLDLVAELSEAPEPARREPITVSGWVNVYPNAVGGLYDSRSYADKRMAPDRIACVYVTGTEGQEP